MPPGWDQVTPCRNELIEVLGTLMYVTPSLRALGSMPSEYFAIIEHPVETVFHSSPLPLTI